MKKIHTLMLIAACALTFTGCSDSDEPALPDPDMPTHSEGAYVLNQGNYTLQVEGSLSFLDYQASAATQDMFLKANGRSLGSTPQGAVVYGGKMYIGMYESNVIEVVDRVTLKSVKQISLTDAEGQYPRSLVARDGKVYVSMFNGFVSRLDTLSLSIDRTVKVGPNPEIMAIRGKYLYVPNSDGMNWQNGYGTTASKIDLTTFTVEKTFTVGLNPGEFVSNGTDLFLLCKGNYGDVPSTVYRIDDADNSTPVDEASLIAMKDDTLYYIYAPYWASEATYTSMSVSSGEKHRMIAGQGVDSPAALGVDPVNGNIVVTSYRKENGTTAYTSPGYANVYAPDGSFLKSFDTGMTPTLVFFSYR